MPVDGVTLRVRGYREFIRATNRAGKEARSGVRTALRQVAEPIRQEAARRFQKYDERSAAHFRIAVTQRGVFVEQGLRKTTGKRPDYGALQMREALLPATHANQPRLERDLERALDLIADHFDA